MSKTASIILSIVLTALIIGGGTYYLTSQAGQNDKQELEFQINELQTQIKQLESSQDSETKTEIESDAGASEDKSQESSVPNDWETYENDYISFVYPNSYEFDRKDSYGNEYFYKRDEYSDTTLGGEFSYGFWIKKITYSSPANFKKWVKNEYKNNAWVANNLEYSTDNINGYTVYQTESLPSHAGTYESFFETNYGYVKIGLNPYNSKNPFEGQKKELNNYNRILETVEIK
jgi:hypothetical protein